MFVNKLAQNGFDFIVKMFVVHDVPQLIGLGETTVYWESSTEENFHKSSSLT